jgi:hypothetical protein
MRDYGVGDEPVPGLAGADVEENFSVFIVATELVDPLNCDFQDKARPSGIGDEQIAAAAENE